MNYQAVIFDLDGTLLINEEVYAQAFGQVLRKYGVEVDDKHPQTPGIGIEENWKILKKQHREMLEQVVLSQLVHETQDAYHEKLVQVKIRPGFFKLQQALIREGIYLALATSNDWWLVEDELEDLDLQKYFAVLVTGEEVVYKKPAPDIFILTAKKMGVAQEKCVVIEDSKAGIEAAKEAKMKAVAVLSSFTKKSDFPRAHLVVEGFENLSPKVLDALF